MRLDGLFARAPTANGAANCEPVWIEIGQQSYLAGPQPACQGNPNPGSTALGDQMEDLSRS